MKFLSSVAFPDIFSPQTDQCVFIGISCFELLEFLERALITTAQSYLWIWIQISFLDLGRNLISDQGIIALSRSIQYIRSLSLWQCGITSDGVKEFAKKLLETEHMVSDVWGRASVDSTSRTHAARGGD